MKPNVPNILSLLRFAMTLVIVILASIPFSNMQMLPYVGFTPIDLTLALLFILASITDALDGKIARKYNLISDFGKFIDPLADKALVNSSLIILAVTKPDLMHFSIVVLMIVRDLAVDGIRFLAASRGEVIPANIYGKLKTVFQMVALPVIFLNGFPFNTFCGEYTGLATNLLMLLPLLASWISGIIYIYRGRRFILGKEKKDAERI